MPTSTTEISPASSAVAALLRARLVRGNGSYAEDFDETTTPRKATAEDILYQAAEAILLQLPPTIDRQWHDRVKHLVALQAAILVEASVFREQADQGAVEIYTNLLRDGLAALQGLLGWSPGMGDGTQPSESIQASSVRMVSETAQGDPLYELYRQVV